MSSINKVILLGRLGQDPVITEFSNGGKIAKFSMVTETSWKDKHTNEIKKKSEWHNIMISNTSIMKIMDYIGKGSRVAVEGELSYKKYTDKNGIQKIATEIVVKPYSGSISIIDYKKDHQDITSNNSSDNNFSGNDNSNDDFTMDFDSFAYDDEIPFK